MAVKKAAVKRAPKKKVAKGDTYTCGVCGLAVVVDTVCGCVDTCDIICCSEPMQSQKPTKRLKSKVVPND